MIIEGGCVIIIKIKINKNNISFTRIIKSLINADELADSVRILLIIIEGLILENFTSGKLK